MEAFGKISAFFMVFPYIRETLQSLTVNAGLPAILLKPLKLGFSASDVAAPDGAPSRSAQPVPAAIEATAEPPAVTEVSPAAPG